MPGPARVANCQKLCMNFVVAALIEVIGESYTFADKTGASPGIVAAFLERALAHPGLKGYASRMAARDVDAAAGFSMRGGLKDVNLMLDAAAEVGCPLDVATIVRGKMQECIEHGLGDADWSAIQEATRARAGLAAT
jgi:3-hydroxyisobutyrate dehydrogenase-like beta-hydroxyacid dehydrogenase